MKNRFPFPTIWLIVAALLTALALPLAPLLARQLANPLTTNDWPMPFHDFGRSRANLLELTLAPPLGATPAQELTYSAGQSMASAAIVANDMLFWYDHGSWDVGGDLLVATDLAGQLLWRFETPATYNLTSLAPVVAGEELFVVEKGYDDSFATVQNVVALDRATGAVLWRHPTHWDDSLYGGAYLPIAVHDGIAYLTWENAALYEGYIAAVNARTGAAIWSTRVDNVGGNTASALAITQDILLGLHHSVLVAYDLSGAGELWQVDTRAGLSLVTQSDDMLAVDGKVAVANNGRISVYAAQTGAELWRDDHDAAICQHDREMAMASNGQLLSVMGVCGDQLVTYNLTTGIESWRVTAHGASELFNIVIANGAVYVNAYDDVNLTDYIAAYDLLSGDLLERIDTLTQSQFAAVMALGAANGRLYAAMRIHTGYPLTEALWVWGGDTVNAYLPAFNDDGLPDTNPDSSAEVSIIQRDGAYGAEISIGARIGSLPATLRIYDANDQLVKSAVGNPDAHGNGFWVAPLEYAASGYEYHIVLGDATEMPRRTVLMPADPAAAVDIVVQTSSLVWQAPPATISSAPFTLTVALPGGFPIGPTGAYAILQTPGVGLLNIAGERVNNTVQFRLDADSAINGDFEVTALVQAGNTTAFSPDLALTIDSPDLPDVRMSNVTAFAPQRDGTMLAHVFSFERDRPAVDPSQQADAQIASVVPDPAGFQVTLWVRTPPEDPLDPLTSKWEVGLSGRDAAGNELDRVTTELPAAPEGKYVVMVLTQPGAEPIATITALGATLEGVTRTTFPFFETVRPSDALVAGCEPPGSPPSDGSKPLKLTDRLNVTTSLGVGGEGSLGIGWGGASYVEGNAVNGQVQACIEGGPRYGIKPGWGPQVGLGASLDLRGSDHDAPANSGRKFDATVAAGVGLQLSYTVPDNFGEGGFGQIGVSITAAPEAGLSVGAAQIVCQPLQSQEPPESKCCTGPNCGPDAANPAPPPGGDHPDDTLSVVLQNTVLTGGQAYWRDLEANANAQGFGELVAYARFRLRDLAYLEQIVAFPVGQPLTTAQQAVLQGHGSNRLLATAAFLAQRATIVAQMDRLEGLRANVLANGYHAEMRQMLSTYGIPNRLVSPDFSPDALSGSMLVIPTAGLYGLEGDTAFADRLARFVELGGTLLVMTQPGNTALNMLPGEWQQVDYHEDTSCYVDAMTLLQYHPILASVAQPQLTAFVDGYMTVIPPGANPLLERTKNQQGAFVLAEHGQGRMLVTNMYDDWGRTVGQSSTAVRNLFRDVVRWASTGGATLPEAQPGAPLTLNIEVHNVIDQPTSQLEWVVREPNGLVVDSGLAVQNLALAAGGAAAQTLTFTPGAPTLGIWSLHYQLLDAADEVLQGETAAGYFIVSNPPLITAATEGAEPAAAPSSLQTSAEVSLLLDKFAYADGEPVLAVLDITLSDPGAVSGLKIMVSLGETTVETLVASAANQQVFVNLPADFSGNGLLFYGVYEQTAGEGLHLNTQWVQPAGDGVTIVPAAPTAEPGDTVTLLISGSYHGSVFIEGADFARTLQVTGEPAVDFDLPAVLSSGPVTVRYTDGGFQRTSRFDVIGPRITVTGMHAAAPIITPGAGAEIVATIVSDRALDVRVTGQVVDGDGYVFPVIDRQESLVAGVQELTLTVPVSATTSGSVRFEMTLADATQTSVVYVRAHRYLTIDAPVLQALRAEGGQLLTGSPPEILLDWYSTSARAVDVTLWLDGNPVASENVNIAAGFTTSPITLPQSLAAGAYTLYARAELGDGLTTNASGILTVVDGEPPSPEPHTVFLPLLLR